MTVGVTGTSGFIGKIYMDQNKSIFDLKSVKARLDQIESIIFEGTTTILHLGGVAHRMNETNPQVYYDGNYELTKQLAYKAKNQGVNHFVFVSTIKTFGEGEDYLSLDSECKPENDPYGESKLKAEEYLKSIETVKFKVAIIRPPLVYGPGVKGNLASLLKLVDSAIPLPFGEIQNRRTMVSVDNLIALINHIVRHQSSGLFLAGDEEPISTTQLISQIRKSMNRKPNLIPIPGFKSLLNILKPALAMRLFGSLEMDTSETFKRLDFVPVSYTHLTLPTKA